MKDLHNMINVSLSSKYTSTQCWSSGESADIYTHHADFNKANKRCTTAHAQDECRDRRVHYWQYTVVMYCAVIQERVTQNSKQSSITISLHPSPSPTFLMKVTLMPSMGTYTLNLHLTHPS